MLGFLDTVALFTASSASRQHLALVTRHVATMPHLFVHSRMGSDDADADMRRSRQGVALAVRHARALRTISVTPDFPAFDAAMNVQASVSDGPAVYLTPYNILSDIQGLLPALIGHNAATLEAVAIQPWWFSGKILEAMRACRLLKSFGPPRVHPAFPAGQAQIEAIVRGSASSLHTLSAPGVLPPLLSFALANCPLQKLTFSYSPDYSPDYLVDFGVLGECATLTDIDASYDGWIDRPTIMPGGIGWWRPCCEQWGRALAKLAQLVRFRLGPPPGAHEFTDLVWRFAPSVRSVKLTNSHIPRLTGDGVERLFINTAETGDIARLAAGLTGLAECHLKMIKWSPPPAGPGTAALEAVATGVQLPDVYMRTFVGTLVTSGLLGRLRVLQLGAPGLATRTLEMDGEALCAIVAACPGLESLDAQVDPSLAPHHLERILEAAKGLRVLKLAFSWDAAEQLRVHPPPHSALGHKGDSASGVPEASVVAANLVVLDAPVCSTGLLSRLVAHRIRRLSLLGDRVGIWAYPEFATLIDLRVQFVCATPVLPPLPSPFTDGVTTLGLGWSDSHEFRSDILLEALRVFRNVTRLHLYGVQKVDQVAAVLVSDECPMTAIGQLAFLSEEPMDVYDVYDAIRAHPEFLRSIRHFKHRHPALECVFVPFRAEDLAAVQVGFHGIGVAAHSTVEKRAHEEFDHACTGPDCYAHLAP